jgi:OmpA-OmpF porin, OOP family
MNFLPHIPRLTLVTLAMGAAAIATPALAAGPYYGGISLGGSDLQNCIGDCTDTGIKILGGYQVNPSVAVELAYTDLGKFGNTRASAFGVSALGRLPIANNFSLLGRLGVNSAKLKRDGSSNSSVELGYGIGVSYVLTPTLDVRGEWERIKFDPVDASLLSVGLTMKF